MDVDSGTLSFTTGGSSSGDFDVATGATLQFPSNTFTLNTGATITGAGTTLVNGGTLTIGGAVSALNLDLLRGTLNGTGHLTMAAGGRLDWTGGKLSGTGKVAIPESGRLSISGASDKLLVTRTIDNLGTTTWSGVGDIRSGSGAVFNNLAGAVFDVRNDRAFSNDLGGASQFNNAGTFRKSAGGLTTSINLTFANTGTVDVDSGTLSYTTGGSSSGEFDVATGATLQFPSNTFTLSTGATVTGAGTTLVNGGTLTIGGAATALNLDVVGGTLNGPGDLTMAAGGQLDWTGGTMSGTGRVTIPESGRLNISGASNKLLATRTIDNLGTTTWSGVGNIRSGSGAMFNNLAGAVFDVRNDQAFSNDLGGAAQVNNAGTFNKTAGLGTTTISVAFINTGTILNTSGGGTLTFTNCTGCP